MQLTALAPGAPCTQGNRCQSGICGTTGTGHCCRIGCQTSSVVCAASDCDDSGACTYPASGTPCAAGTCNEDVQIGPASCDGSGSCTVSNTQDCAPYACAGAACLQSCASSASCAPGASCEVDKSVCCAGLGDGATLNVDAVTGSDAVACCGTPGAAACQTLTRAMSLIDSTQAQNVTLEVTVDGGGGDWSPSAEVYPVVLGWGVELNAPGVFFLDPNGLGNTAIFDVRVYSSNDTVGHASIVGSAPRAVGVGMNATNTQQTDDQAAIHVETGTTLFIANANVNGSALNRNQEDAFLVASGGSLWLGQDQSAAITGTVHIGNALGQSATDGWIGIACDSNAHSSQPCMVHDAPLVDQSAVVLQGQEGFDISAADFANIILTANPVIGVPPSTPGLGTCGTKLDGTINAAVSILGLSTFTFKNGTVQCIGGSGLTFGPTASGNPTVNLENCLIQNTDLGVLAEAGTVTMTNSLLRYNVVGVEQSGSASIDLSGGGNTVICSNGTESSQHRTAPGVDVYNNGTASLNASDVAWDTPGPDYFKCDVTFANCSCNLASCTGGAGSNGMDAVENSTRLGGIITSGNTVSDAGCH